MFPRVAKSARLVGLKNSWDGGDGSGVRAA